MRIIQATMAALVAAAWFGSAGQAHGQTSPEFPTRPVTIVVPAPPGGVADGLARAVATQLAKELKQPVIVDNKAGAAGVIGTGYVAKAPPKVVEETRAMLAAEEAELAKLG